MLRYPVFLSLFCGLVCFSCTKKEEVKYVVNSSGAATLENVKLNFDLNAGVSFTDTDKLYFEFIYKENGLERLEFLIANIPEAVGTYQIEDYTVPGEQPKGLLYTGSGDVIYDNYKILDGALNTFTIDALDMGKGEASGTFDLTFVVDTTSGVKTDIYPDTIFLKNGTFFGAYKD